MPSRNFWLVFGIVLLAAGALITYRLSRRTAQPMTRHQLTGYVLEVSPETSRITVRNDDIPGVMTSMVMDYRVKDTGTLSTIKRGDVIQATMVSDDSYWLENIKVTGQH